MPHVGTQMEAAAVAAASPQSQRWGQADAPLNATLVARVVEHASDDVRCACVCAALAAGRRVSLAAVATRSQRAGWSCAAGSRLAADFLYHRKFAVALDAARSTGARRQRAADAHLLPDATFLVGDLV
jgi:hypothetical protein